MWVAAGTLAVVALGAGAFALSGAGDRNDAKGHAGLPRPSAARSARNAGLGARGEAALRGEEDAVLDRTGADGAFIVTVTGVRCGVRAVGRALPRRRAHGQRCLVGVAVENAGRETRLLDDGAQRAVDVHGRAYAPVTAAAAFPKEPIEQVPPGATVRGVLPFDVPRGTRLSALLVHESVTSRGARIALY